MAERDWQRLGEYVTERMRELNMSQAHLETASGISAKTIGRFMAGEPRGTPRGTTLVDLARGLGWSDNSVDAILDGGEPVVAHRTGSDLVSLPSAVVDEIQARATRVDAELAAIRRLLSRARTTGGAPPSQP